MKNYGIIPARLQSSRLPRKLLLNVTGQPLLQYGWEAACQATLLDAVIIATDSEEIAGVARRFGARVEMTRDHPSGSDRIAEIAERCCADADIIVNIQGDEPEIDPANVDAAVRVLLEDRRSQMSTLAAPITNLEVLQDPNCVKVVRSVDGRAIYFSRAPVPYCRDRSVAEVLSETGRGRRENSEQSPWLLHIGLYGYRRDFLLEYTRLPPSPLEQLEKLEQLRAIEAGASIHVAIVPHRSVGIDTPADYALFVHRTSTKAA